MAIGVFNWHRVAIRFEDDLPVGRERHRHGGATGKIVFRSWAQIRLFQRPRFLNAHRLAIYPTQIILQAFDQEMGVEGGEISHLGNRHQKISAGVPHRTFDAAFFVTLSRRAKSAVEQIVTAEDDEGALLFARPSFQLPVAPPSLIS